MSKYFELEKKKLENKFAVLGNKYMNKLLPIISEYQAEQNDLSTSYRELTEAEKAEKQEVKKETTEEKIEDAVEELVDGTGKKE